MNQADRIKGAIYGALIGDALAMPTHWFYGGTSQIQRLYNGLITGYTKPISILPGSILPKSNTGGGGRGAYSGDIIGKVIFHDKKKYWDPQTSYHYHQGMKAGDNTLEALLLRRILPIITKNNGKFVPNDIIQDYISFMTTPDTHNDTYCGTSHRMFFSNYSKGIEISKCPDNDGHNVDSSDSIVTTIPIALLAKNNEEALTNIETMVYLTRNSPNSVYYSKIFGILLRNIIRGNSIKDSIEKLSDNVPNLKLKHYFHQFSNSDPMTACYLDSSFPAALFMAFKYSVYENGFKTGLLANSNRGGENVATGCLIGALLGAECGFSNIPKDLIDGLATDSKELLEKDVDQFISTIDDYDDNPEDESLNLDDTSSFLSKILSIVNWK